MTHNNLGQLYLNYKDFSNALQSFQIARSQLNALVAICPKEINCENSLGGTLNNLGMTLEQMGRLDEALLVYREGIEHQQFVVDAAPTLARFREILSIQYANYVRALEAAGRTSAAVEAILAAQAAAAQGPPAAAGRCCRRSGARRARNRPDRELRTTKRRSNGSLPMWSLPPCGKLWMPGLIGPKFGGGPWISPPSVRIPDSGN